ncbi:XdhC family protein [Cohnella pontilimi]|uniref:XdhC family protein n=1 Tax=Cohnella pontilimi TaxID=2564100 RepID=A0A4V5LS10_9BACL|nr:XdhC family protein [Cohnella pontilimi]TJY41309.1 XdhC family protein [Cohnella pontilimi]
MDSIHAVLQAIEQSEEYCVLASIVRVVGSSYRKEGTAALYMESGKRVGMLTAGCLEEDLALRAREMYGTNAPKLIKYDLSAETETEWGRGFGCNGEIHILLEPIDDKQRQALKEIKIILEQGKSVNVVKAVEGETYIHTYQPKPRLILLGAGQDARPVSKLAARLGFYVIVWDWRPSFCAYEYFPDADQRWVGAPEEVIPGLHLRQDDCVVLMTHDFQKDRELLALVRDTELLYLGVLGPKARTSRLVLEEALLERIHSPVGLPIGAEGPEEIAVSIAADLILHVRRGTKCQKNEEGSFLQHYLDVDFWK